MIIITKIKCVQFNNLINVKTMAKTEQRQEEEGRNSWERPKFMKLENSYIKNNKGNKCKQKT